MSSTASIFALERLALLEPPRHVQLADDAGRPIERGSHVIIKSVLEPETPGGEVRYIVKMNRGDAQMLTVCATLRAAGRRCSSR